MGVSNVLGIEQDTEMIYKAKQSLSDFQNFKFIQGDIEKTLPQIEEKFDIVLCMGVLYYLDCQEVLLQCRKRCKRLMIVDSFVNRELVPSLRFLQNCLCESGFNYTTLDVPNDFLGYGKKRFALHCRPIIPLF